MNNKKKFLWILAVLVLSSSVFGALTDKLRNYYDFDNASISGGMLSDKTGNTNLAILTANTGKPGLINQEFYFDGNDYINNGSARPWAAATENITLSIWINTTANTTQQQTGGIVTLTVNEGTLVGILLATGEINCMQGKSGVFNNIASSGFKINNNVRYHLVCVYDATANNLSVYVNGNYKGSAISNCDTCSADAEIRFGDNGGGGTNYWIGNLEETGIWNRTLTPSEISSLYNLGKGCAYSLFSVDCIMAAPVINNATYNLTSASAGQNSTAWRNGNEASPIKTIDTTPTVTFNTTNNAYCRINKANQNWTTMGNTRNCTTTGGTVHTCTVIAGDAYTLGSGYNGLFIGCIDSTLVNETANSTSGELMLTLGTTPYATGTAISPDPAYTDDTLNCSFTVIDTDSTLINVSVNWNSGGYVQNFTNIANNTFLNSSWIPAYPKGTVVNCVVNVTDGESSGAFSDSLTINNTVPSGFAVTSPTEWQVIFGNATNVSWTCSDADAETLTAYWFLNGTYNGTDTNLTDHVLVELAYDVCYTLNATCGDNETNTSFVQRNFCTNSSSLCTDMTVTGIIDNSRYIGLEHEVSISCAGGFLPVGCAWSVNNYAMNTATNCSSFNITLENGHNNLVLVAYDASNTTLDYSVWSKDPDSDIFDFVLLWVFIGVYIGCMVFGAWSGLGVMYLLGFVPAFFIGFQLLAISYVAGVATMFILGTISLVLVALKK